MKKKVYFLGFGNECIKFIWIDAKTNLEAFEKAEQIYKDNSWSFKYEAMKIDKYDSEF